MPLPSPGLSLYLFLNTNIMDLITSLVLFVLVFFLGVRYFLKVVKILQIFSWCYQNLAR